jgi:serine/threonine protein kinase
MTNPRWLAPEVLNGLPGQLPAGKRAGEPPATAWSAGRCRWRELACPRVLPPAPLSRLATLPALAAPPSDVWAFGTVLWELLTWRLPFEDLNTFQARGRAAGRCCFVVLGSVQAQPQPGQRWPCHALTSLAV